MQQAVSQTSSATLIDCDRAFDCLAALCLHADDLGMDRLAAALEDALDACLVERARRVLPQGTFVSRRVPRRKPPLLTLRRDQRRA